MWACYNYAWPSVDQWRPSWNMDLQVQWGCNGEDSIINTDRWWKMCSWSHETFASQHALSPCYHKQWSISLQSRLADSLVTLSATATSEKNHEVRMPAFPNQLIGCLCWMCHCLLVEALCLTHSDSKLTLQTSHWFRHQNLQCIRTGVKPWVAGMRIDTSERIEQMGCSASSSQGRHHQQV